jgi:hypothetical protein
MNNRLFGRNNSEYQLDKFRSPQRRLHLHK